MEPASTAEIASIRRRYLWMAVSVAGIDLFSTMVFLILTGAWAYAPISLGAGFATLVVTNLLLAAWLFEPIRRFLEGRGTFDEAQRRITQLPLLTARNVAALSLILVAFRLSADRFLPDLKLGIPEITPADLITLCVVLPVFLFTYTYFAISDYLAKLCAFIFQHYGQTLGLFLGSYALKLGVALIVISIGPLAAVIVDLFSYDGQRLKMEIGNDVGVAVVGVIVVAYFIGRSLLRPIRILSRAMSKVADGDFTLRIPVTSNDEVGELTGRFNAMVEGLREREKIRETFGRYVDESVAATILRRQGDSALAGETGEATILFTDIAGFTTIAEYLSPDELVAALNDYLETVLAPIRAHGGVVNTFIGDGLFASFNMPLACDDHAACAVRAAIDIQRAVGSRTFGDTGVALAPRIGLSTGPVIGGSVGAGQRMSYTLLGDTVNLAARLEQLNKEHGTRILVSDSARAACGDRFTFTSLGSVAVRGRSEQVAIFSVDPHGQESPS